MCWCCYCQFDSTVTYAYFTGKVFFCCFPPSNSVFSKFCKIWWWNTEQALLTFTWGIITAWPEVLVRKKKKNHDTGSLSVGKIRVLIKLLKVMLIQPNLWKFSTWMKHYILSSWNGYFGFDCPGILCYKAFKILLRLIRMFSLNIIYIFHL